MEENVTMVLRDSRPDQRSYPVGRTAKEFHKIICGTLKNAIQKFQKLFCGTLVCSHASIYR